MQLINYNQYITELKKQILTNKKVALNCSIPSHQTDTKYFKSEQGISYLRKDGFMGGLCRTEKGSENVAKLHQTERIERGGYFLECYDGKLVEIYLKQGFKIVSKLTFNKEFAPKGWEQDNQLKNKPDVVFMSRYVTTSRRFSDYESAYNFAKNTK